MKGTLSPPKHSDTESPHPTKRTSLPTPFVFWVVSETRKTVGLRDSHGLRPLTSYRDNRTRVLRATAGFCGRRLDGWHAVQLEADLRRVFRRRAPANFLDFPQDPVVRSE